MTSVSGPTTIPGLTATITVPDNSVTIISTDGGVTNLGPGVFGSVGIRVLIDLAPPPAGAGARVVMVKRETTLFDMVANWSMQFSVVLTPGVHTVSVAAEHRALGNINPALQSSAAVSGDANSFLQGTLTLTTLKR